MLDDLILEKIIHSFFGYGSYEADTLFVGMEEGGGSGAALDTGDLGTAMSGECLAWAVPLRVPRREISGQPSGG